MMEKPWRTGRSFFNFSNTVVSLRVAAISQNSRVTLGSNPQKPVNNNSFCSNRAFSAFPVEPVQSPTITLYTF